MREKDCALSCAGPRVCFETSGPQTHLVPNHGFCGSNKRLPSGPRRECRPTVISMWISRLRFPYKTLFPGKWKKAIILKTRWRSLGGWMLAREPVGEVYAIPLSCFSCRAMGCLEWCLAMAFPHPAQSGRYPDRHHIYPPIVIGLLDGATRLGAPPLCLLVMR